MLLLYRTFLHGMMMKPLPNWCCSRRRSATSVFGMKAPVNKNIINTNNGLLVRMTNEEIDDEMSRLGQYMWDEIEGNHFPVLVRNENDRYVSKLLMEVLVLKGPDWQMLAMSPNMRGLCPMKPYLMTKAERWLLKHICEHHLTCVLSENGVCGSIKNVLATDQLLSYDEFLSFYETATTLKSSTEISYQRPFHRHHHHPPQIVFHIPLTITATSRAGIANVRSCVLGPRPNFTILPHTSSTRGTDGSNGNEKTYKDDIVDADVHCVGVAAEAAANDFVTNDDEDGDDAIKRRVIESQGNNGWVQINNVFVPYITKIGLSWQSHYRHGLNRCLLPLNGRRYVPLQILINCGIVSEISLGQQQQHQSSLADSARKHELSRKQSHIDALTILRALSVKANKEDTVKLNRLIVEAKLYTDLLSPDCDLVNLYHLIICSPKLTFAKFLGQNDPKTNITKRFKEIVERIERKEHLIGCAKFYKSESLVPYVADCEHVNEKVIPIKLCPKSSLKVLTEPHNIRLARRKEIDLMSVAFVCFNIENVLEQQEQEKTVNKEEVMVYLDQLCRKGLIETYTTLEEFRTNERQKILTALAQFTANEHRSATAAGEKTKLNFAQYVLMNDCAGGGYCSSSTHDKQEKSCKGMGIANEPSLLNLK